MAVCAALRAREMGALPAAALRPGWRLASSFACAGPHAGSILVDPSGTPSLPFAIAFNKVHRDCKLLAVVDEQGYLSIVDTADTKLTNGLYSAYERKARAQWVAHRNAIFDVTWARHDSRIYTASGDQTVGVWDTWTAAQLCVCKGHSGSVKSVCSNTCSHDVFASGSRDGAVMIWDVRMPTKWSERHQCMHLSPVHTIEDIHSDFKGRARVAKKDVHKHSVTAVQFMRDNTWLATAGAINGTVKFWDLRKIDVPALSTMVPLKSSPQQTKARLRKTTNKTAKAYHEEPSLAFTCPSKSSRPHGITCISVSDDGSQFLVSASDSCHYLYNTFALDKPPSAILSGHSTATFYIKAAFSPDGRHVISGSSDKMVRVWDVNKPDEGPYLIEGHDREVTGVSWCPTDFTSIATCSDDATVKVWTLKRQEVRDSMTDDEQRPLPVGTETVFNGPHVSKHHTNSLDMAPITPQPYLRTLNAQSCAHTFDGPVKRDIFEPTLSNIDRIGSHQLGTEFPETHEKGSSSPHHASLCEATLVSNTENKLRTTVEERCDVTCQHHRPTLQSLASSAEQNLDKEDAFAPSKKKTPASSKDGILASQIMVLGNTNDDDFQVFCDPCTMDTEKGGNSSERQKGGDEDFFMKRCVPLDHADDCSNNGSVILETQRQPTRIENSLSRDSRSNERRDLAQDHALRENNGGSKIECTPKAKHASDFSNLQSLVQDSPKTYDGPTISDGISCDQGMHPACELVKDGRRQSKRKKELLAAPRCKKTSSKANANMVIKSFPVVPEPEAMLWHPALVTSIPFCHDLSNSSVISPNALTLSSPLGHAVMQPLAPRCSGQCEVRVENKNRSKLATAQGLDPPETASDDMSGDENRAPNAYTPRNGTHRFSCSSCHGSKDSTVRLPLQNITPAVHSTKDNQGDMTDVRNLENVRIRAHQISIPPMRKRVPSSLPLDLSDVAPQPSLLPKKSKRIYPKDAIPFELTNIKELATRRSNCSNGDHVARQNMRNAGTVKVPPDVHDQERSRDTRLKLFKAKGSIENESADWEPSSAKKQRRLKDLWTC